MVQDAEIKYPLKFASGSESEYDGMEMMEKKIQSKYLPPPPQKSSSSSSSDSSSSSSDSEDDDGQRDSFESDKK